MLSAIFLSTRFQGQHVDVHFLARPISLRDSTRAQESSEMCASPSAPPKSMKGAEAADVADDALANLPDLTLIQQHLTGAARASRAQPPVPTGIRRLRRRSSSMISHVRFCLSTSSDSFALSSLPSRRPARAASW